MKYIKTEVGQQAFKQRSPSISARQRPMFLLFDGQKTAEQVLAATAGMGLTAADVQALVDLGYLAPVPSEAPPVPAAQEAPAQASGAMEPGRQEPALKGSVLRGLAGAAGVW